MSFLIDCKFETINLYGYLMKNKVQNIYKIELEKYIQNIKRSKVDIKVSRDRLEFQFESLSDWSQVHKFEYIKKWFLKKEKIQELK